MPIISQKRRVTLPLEQCLKAGIQPGDEYESFVCRKGIISILRKRKGTAKGLLKDIPVYDEVSDEDSLENDMR